MAELPLPINMSMYIREKGQAMLEVLIALSVATVIVSALGIVVVSALKTAQSSSYKTLATQYAQEGLEIVRQMAADDWATLSTLASLASGHYCLDKNSSTLVARNQANQGCSTLTPLQPNPNNVDIFARQVDLTPQPGAGVCTGGILVTTTVSWTDGSCRDVNNLYCHLVKASTCAYKTAGLY